MRERCGFGLAMNKCPRFIAVDKLFADSVIMPAWGTCSFGLVGVRLLDLVALRVLPETSKVEHLRSPSRGVLNRSGPTRLCLVSGVPWNGDGYFKEAVTTRGVSVAHNDLTVVTGD